MRVFLKWLTPQRWMHKLWSDMEDNPVIFLGLAFLLVRFHFDDVLVQWLLWMYRCNQLRSSTMPRPSPWPPAESPWDAEATLRQGLLHQWCSSPGGNGRSGCKWSSVQHHIKSIADISHWCVIASYLSLLNCYTIGVSSADIHIWIDDTDTYINHVFVLSMPGNQMLRCWKQNSASQPMLTMSWRGCWQKCVWMWNRKIIVPGFFSFTGYMKVSHPSSSCKRSGLSPVGLIAFSTCWYCFDGFWISIGKHLEAPKKARHNDDLHCRVPSWQRCAKKDTPLNSKWAQNKQFVCHLVNSSLGKNLCPSINLWQANSKQHPCKHWDRLRISMENVVAPGIPLSSTLTHGLCRQLQR